MRGSSNFGEGFARTPVYFQERCLGRLFDASARKPGTFPSVHAGAYRRPGGPDRSGLGGRLSLPAPKYGGSGDARGVFSRFERSTPRTGCLRRRRRVGRACHCGGRDRYQHSATRRAACSSPKPCARSREWRHLGDPGSQPRRGGGGLRKRGAGSGKSLRAATRELLFATNVVARSPTAAPSGIRCATDNLKNSKAAPAKHRDGLRIFSCGGRI